MYIHHSLNVLKLHTLEPSIKATTKKIDYFMSHDKYELHINQP
ncbi:hypothetical protein [Escherichia coli IS1]|nr:hypothetical protein HMPREF9534_05364 [Escherichia coli MS 69-1]ESD76216.1 hypothetical protein HMPREF1611_05623 [Escherichia coli 908573]KDW69284.1 hypothetical protein AB14_5284 [Escherichia coli 1-392-07_S1_C1]KEM53640.1 hypothetical protein AB79_1754 [Escherichia coli 6-175-07_S1_C3]CDK46609.1 hypothetical protein [Escherichia coli IS1]